MARLAGRRIVDRVKAALVNFTNLDHVDHPCPWCGCRAMDYLTIDEDLVECNICQYAYTIGGQDNG